MDNFHTFITLKISSIFQLLHLIKLDITFLVIQNRPAQLLTYIYFLTTFDGKNYKYNFRIPVVVQI